MEKENKIQLTASLLKSIGHPIRIEIILYLAHCQCATVTKISNDLSVQQPIISLHLSVLRKQKVITVKKEGKKSLYSISDISVKQIVNIIYNTRKKLN